MKFLYAQDQRKPPLPKGLGTAIMEHFRIPASRQIGDLKKTLETAIDAGELEPFREAEFYVAFIERHGLIPR